MEENARLLRGKFENLVLILIKFSGFGFNLADTWTNWYHYHPQSVALGRFADDSTVIDWMKHMLHMVCLILILLPVASYHVVD